MSDDAKTLSLHSYSESTTDGDAATDLVADILTGIYYGAGGYVAGVCLAPKFALGIGLGGGVAGGASGGGVSGFWNSLIGGTGSIGHTFNVKCPDWESGDPEYTKPSVSIDFNGEFGIANRWVYENYVPRHWVYHN